MSFGTFTLFNFFQQPNTGRTPPRNSYDVGAILDSASHSGTVADFNWTFPYAGNAVPFPIVEGGGGLFQLKLFSDSEVGLRPASVYQTFSGEFEGKVERFFLGDSISGDFVPKDTDNSYTQITISGLISGSPIDISVGYLTFSGDFRKDNPDKSYSFITFSGSVDNNESQPFSIISQVSGLIESGNQERPYFTLGFSGGFTPTHSDICNVSYSFLSFSGVSGKIISGINIEDECNVKYGFNSYYSTRGD